MGRITERKREGERKGKGREGGNEARVNENVNENKNKKQRQQTDCMNSACHNSGEMKKEMGVKKRIE